jgi:hypothetical protein
MRVEIFLPDVAGVVARRRGGWCGSRESVRAADGVNPWAGKADGVNPWARWRLTTYSTEVVVNDSLWSARL